MGCIDVGQRNGQAGPFVSECTRPCSETISLELTSLPRNACAHLRKNPGKRFPVRTKDLEKCEASSRYHGDQSALTSVNSCHSVPKDVFQRLPFVPKAYDVTVAQHLNMSTVKERKFNDPILIPSGTNMSAKRKLVMWAPVADCKSNQGSHLLDTSEYPNAKKKVKLFTEAKTESSTIKNPLGRRVATSIVDYQNEKIASLSNDFWECIRPNYVYLMKNDLIAACKETEEELTWTNMSSSASCSWTFTYFIQRFNQLHDNLHSLHALALKEIDSKLFLQEMESHILKLLRDSKVLRDQALFLEFRYPAMKDDIWKRCNILNNKWDALERSLWPQMMEESEGNVKRIIEQMKNFRKWIRGIDKTLKDLEVKEDLTNSQIKEVYLKQQDIQKEIESRGREITSLVKESWALEGATGESRVLRAAKNLERTWHRTWLCSLETQCLTEQILQNQGKAQSARSTREPDTDEGPMNKHRRLTSVPLCHFPGTNVLGMDSGSKGSHTQVLGDGLNLMCGMRAEKGTREVGILCSVHKDITQVNDKCIMVGTTGIAALKAEYGDDFTNFEIIQDVGYSSESSTHLSSDDISECIRIFSYSPSMKQFSAPLCDTAISERIKLPSPADFSLTSVCKGFGHSSLGSSSSHNDSGLGAVDCNVSFGEDVTERDERHEASPISSPGYLDSCSEGISEDNIDFSILSEREDLNTYSTGDGFDTDDPNDTYHTRSSFRTSAQEFYKMTLVDSDHADQEPFRINELQRMVKECSDDNFPKSDLGNVNLRLQELSPQPTVSSPCSSTEVYYGHGEAQNNPSSAVGACESCRKTKTSSSSFLESDHSFPSDIECLPTKEVRDWPDSDFSDDSLLHKHYKNHLCSSPLQYSQHLKLIPRGRRRRLSVEVSDNSAKGFEFLNSPVRTKTHRSTRVREWLKRCSSGRRSSALFPGGRHTTARDESASADLPPYHHHQVPVSIDTTIDSSCDASGEYTTNESDADCSSCDDFLGSTSFTFSGSGMGSAETVVPPEYQTSRRRGTGTPSSEYTHILLPPPPPSTPLSLKMDCGPFWGSRRRLCSGTTTHHSSADRVRSVSEGDLNTYSKQEENFCHSNEALVPLAAHPFCHPKLDVSSLSSFRHSSGMSKRERYWLRSLPSIFLQESDQSSSDSRSHLNKCSTSGSRTCASGCSSSEVRHRNRGSRSRKRSSSLSHRSGRSGNIEDKRPISLNPRPSLIATRRRHLSQIQVEDELFSQREREGKAVNGAVKSGNIDMQNREGVLQSPENDACLIQLEEQSTVSDQVWDGYQDMPYLSEAYSELTVDEDAVRKLTEFGDDYCSAIGSKARGLASKRGSKTDPLVSGSIGSEEVTAYAVLKTASCSPTKHISSHVDSDSDIEDFQDILAETCGALHFARNTLDGGALTQAECAELLATCKTHLSCLQVICEHIVIDEKESSFSHEDLAELHDLIQQWEVVQKTAVMSQKSEKYQKAQQDIDSLYFEMSELPSAEDFDPKDFSSLKDLEQKIEMIQMALHTLQETNQKLLLINFQVHRIVTESGDTKSPLKDGIIELYQQWDDAYEQNGSQLTDLQLLYKKWQEFDANYRKLKSRLQHERALLKLGEDEVVLTEVEDDDERGVNLEDRLKKLQMDASFLECRLRGGMVWSSMADDLRHLHDELKELRRHLGSGDAESTTLGAPRVHSNRQLESAVESGDEEVLEDTRQGKTEAAVQSSSSSSSSDPGCLASEVEERPPSTGSRLWRVVRAALPIQLAFVILYCLACAFEPHCCDVLNNFNFSLSPQLRYVRGPPPV